MPTLRVLWRVGIHLSIIVSFDTCDNKRGLIDCNKGRGHGPYLGLTQVPKLVLDTDIFKHG